MMFTTRNDPIQSTVSLPLADGTRFTVFDTYSEGQSKAVIVRGYPLLDSRFPLSKMSAFNTRTVKGPHMFVRTHVAFYFVSLLVSDILQCEFLSLFVHPPGGICDLDVVHGL